MSYGAVAFNDAIIDNPPSYPIDITTHGSDWLWAVFAIMTASGIASTVMAYRLPEGKRAFHWIGSAILFTAAIAYFSMASNLGKTGIPVEFNRHRSNLYEGNESHPLRSIWYARYIDWTITTPLLLLELLLATGLPLSNIFFTIFMDLVMIETGLIGALVQSQYKWGFYTFGCAAMLYIFFKLVGPGRHAAYALGTEAGTAYTRSTAVLLVLWFLYPIAWGVADGGNYITPDSEMVFYGVLDVLAKPVFLFFHLFALHKVDYDSLALTSGHFSIGVNGEKVPATQTSITPGHSAMAESTHPTHPAGRVA